MVNSQAKLFRLQLVEEYTKVISKMNYYVVKVEILKMVMLNRVNLFKISCMDLDAVISKMVMFTKDNGKKV
jgi:hypothetical protein